MIFIFLIIVCLNIIVGIKNKRNNVLLFLTYALILVLSALNTDGPDFYNYFNDYLLSAQGEHKIAETGFFAISWMFNKVNLDYFMFRIIVVGVCLLLIRSTVGYFNGNENLVLGLYMGYLLFMDTIQIRNFILEAVFIFSLRYLFVNKKFNTLKYIICIFIASGFHRIAVVYLLLLLMKIKINDRTYKYGLLLSISVFVIFMFDRSLLVAAINGVVNLLNIKSGYYVSTSTQLSFLPFVGLYLFEIFVIAYYGKKTMGKSSDKKLVKRLLQCCIVFSFLLPLLLINLNFLRLFRNLYIIKYIVLSRIIGKLNKKSESRQLAFITISIVILCSVLDCIVVNDVAKIIVPIFRSNLIFNNSVYGMQFSILQKVISITFVALICLCNRRRAVAPTSNYTGILYGSNKKRTIS